MVDIVWEDKTCKGADWKFQHVSRWWQRVYCKTVKNAKDAQQNVSTWRLWMATGWLIRSSNESVPLTQLHWPLFFWSHCGPIIPSRHESTQISYLPSRVQRWLEEPECRERWWRTWWLRGSSGDRGTDLVSCDAYQNLMKTRGLRQETWKQIQVQVENFLGFLLKNV